jgi:hypothetical protein
LRDGTEDFYELNDRRLDCFNLGCLPKRGKWGACKAEAHAARVAHDASLLFK